MSHIFITARPTQIITALAVCEHLDLSNDTTIIVSNSFENASVIVDNFSSYKPAFNFSLVPSFDAAIEAAISKMPAHVFLYLDVGFRAQKKIRRLRQANGKNKISVFEDGVGTYRKDIYSIAKKIILSLLGFPVNAGGSKYIDDIYLFDKKKYIENAQNKPNNIIQIKTGLIDFIDARQKELWSVFSARDFYESFKSMNGKICLIYLSNYEFDISDLTDIFHGDGVKILKLHPHCNAKIRGNDIIISPKWVPAELLITLASDIFDCVHVFHQNSSASLYIKKKNVKFTNLG